MSFLVAPMGSAGPVTYLGFHLVFLLVPTLTLTAVALRAREQLGRRTPLALFGVAPLALLYTARWDQYLIANRVWWYGEDRVLGSWLGVPFEEYAFMLVQPVLTGALLLALLARRQTVRRPGWDRATLATGLTVGSLVVVVGLAGGITALRADAPWTYLGLILVWALPPLGALVAAAWNGLTFFASECVTAWALSTAYLGVADRIAIGAGIWTISPVKSTGALVGGLPVEEALFFAVTNALVVAGAMLFWLPGLPAEASTAA